jgi:Mg2+ and Co2+ transporter CorA
MSLSCIQLLMQCEKQLATNDDSVKQVRTFIENLKRSKQDRSDQVAQFNRLIDYRLQLIQRYNTIHETISSMSESIQNAAQSQKEA